MKRVLSGIVIFIVISGFFWLQSNLELAMTITGIIGVGGVLIGGFLKTGFISSSAPVIGNLAIIKLDKTINLSNTILLIALPNFVGAFLLYFFN